MLLNILDDVENSDKEENKRRTNASANLFEEKFALFVGDETIFGEDIIIFSQG